MGLSQSLCHPTPLWQTVGREQGPYTLQEIFMQEKVCGSPQYQLAQNCLDLADVLQISQKEIQMKHKRHMLFPGYLGHAKPHRPCPASSAVRPCMLSAEEIPPFTAALWPK